MSLTAPTGSVSNIEPLEPATYPARLQMVLDLGLQAQSFMGQEKPPANELLLGFELLDEFLDGEDGEPDLTKPRMFSRRMPLRSLDNDKANSTKFYNVLDPTGQFSGDFSQTIGTPVLVTLVQSVRRSDGRVFNNIDRISPMRAKDAEVADPMVQEPTVLDLDNFQAATFDRLPEWMQRIIRNGIGFDEAAKRREEVPF